DRVEKNALRSCHELDRIAHRRGRQSVALAEPTADEIDGTGRGRRGFQKGRGLRGEGMNALSHRFVVLAIDIDAANRWTGTAQLRPRDETGLRPATRRSMHERRPAQTESLELAGDFQIGIDV